MWGVYSHISQWLQNQKMITEENLLYLVIGFSWLTFMWDMYLSIRQYMVLLKTKDVPQALSGVLDQETLSKARAYNLDKSRFSFVSGTWSQILSTFVLIYFVTPWIWSFSGRILPSGYGEISQTLVFLLVGSVASTILDLPWSIYSNFVIEERHGFNKQTPGFYAKDRIKKFFVSQAITAPIVAGTVYIIKAGGDYFFVYLWAFVTIVALVMMTVYPDFIAPLFDKYTPLPDGHLKTGIEELAASIEFPLKKLYVVEGSKRSAHSNAYFFGFYKNKRIVLFDTLIEDYEPPVDANASADAAPKSKPDDAEKEEKKKTGCTNGEVLAVLAHELGHWKMNHVLKNLIITEVNLFLCFGVFGLLYKNQLIYSAFGFRDEMPVFIGLLLIFQYIFSVYNEIMGFFMMCLSRKFEFQADGFAKTLNKTSELRSALIKLNKDNLSFPVYDPLYSKFNHSHPPLIERLDALGKVE